MTEFWPGGDFGVGGKETSPMPTYIHSCPRCHEVHESTLQDNEFCGEHQEQYSKWKNRNRYSPGNKPWKCDGCSGCQEGD